jgi:hypothetical protein
MRIAERVDENTILERGINMVRRDFPDPFERQLDDVRTVPPDTSELCFSGDIGNDGSATYAKPMRMICERLSHIPSTSSVNTSRSLLGRE